MAAATMRLSLFARGSLLDEQSLTRLAARGWRGVDVRLGDLIGPDASSVCGIDIGRSHLKRLCCHGLQAVLRISTLSPLGSSAPTQHVDQLENGLAVISALSAGALSAGIAHVAVQVHPELWDLDDAITYLAGALPLAAIFNEQHPHIGTSARETDAFGGRPAHLIGVSTVAARACWGPAAVSVST